MAKSESESGRVKPSPMPGPYDICFSYEIQLIACGVVAHVFEPAENLEIPVQRIVQRAVGIVAAVCILGIYIAPGVMVPTSSTLVSDQRSAKSTPSTGPKSCRVRFKPVVRTVSHHAYQLESPRLTPASARAGATIVAASRARRANYTTFFSSYVPIVYRVRQGRVIEPVRLRCTAVLSFPVLLYRFFNR